MPDAAKVDYHGTPRRVVIAHPAAHLGGYIGLGFTVLLSLAAFAFSVWLGLMLIAASVIGFVILEVIRRADRLALYEDGVAREYRLVSTKRTFAEYEAIQDIQLQQGVIERILGIGTIHINTSGSHGQEIVFSGISSCHEIEREIRERMRPHSVDTPAA